MRSGNIYLKYGSDRILLSVAVAGYYYHNQLTSTTVYNTAVAKELVNALYGYAQWVALPLRCLSTALEG